MLSPAARQSGRSWTSRAVKPDRREFLLLTLSDRIVNCERRPSTAILHGREPRSRCPCRRWPRSGSEETVGAEKNSRAEQPLIAGAGSGLRFSATARLATE